MKLTPRRRKIMSLIGVVLSSLVLAVPAPAETATYLTTFAKDNNVFTNLNEQFPHTDKGTGVPGSGVGTANASFFFNPAPAAVAAARYAPDYIDSSNLVNNGVDFKLTSDANGHDFASFSTTGVTVPIRVNNVQIVYALLGAYNGQTVKTTFTGADGTQETFTNISIPDFNGGSINVASDTFKDRTVFQVNDVGAGGSGNSTTGAFNRYSLTEVSFPLSSRLSSQELVSVTFTANGYEGLLLAVTADSDVPVPTATLTSPPANIKVVTGAAIPLTASVSDPGSVFDSVQFLLDGRIIASTATAAPFTATETFPVAGSYILSAVARDILGRTSALSTVFINVVDADPANPPPTASLVTPLAGLNLAANSTLTLTATADSPATGLDHEVIYVDGVAVATFDGQGNLITSDHGGALVRLDATGTPVSNAFSAPYTLPGTDKLLNMVAVAFDKLGLASVSGVSSVHSTVTSDKAPLVAISNLAATALVAVGSVNAVDVSASDPDTVIQAPGSMREFTTQDTTLDGTLAKLAFYINGALATLLDNPQASSNFSFTPPAPGKYILHSVATDGSGLSTVSDPVVVTAALPTVTITAAGDGMAVEGGEAGKVLVVRTGDTSQPLTVFYKAKGSAVKDVDYKPLSGVATIPAGASKVKIKVKPLDDKALESTLKVKVRLLPPADGNYTLGDPAVAKIRVVGEE